MDRKRTLSALEVEHLIDEGKIIVIYEGHALRLDSWLNKHPGGKLPIEHMVGRDATSEINAYHLSKTQSLMKAYRIGRVALPWTNLTPPIARTHRADAIEKSTASTDVDSEAEWSDSTLADSTADLVTITQQKLHDEGLPTLIRLRTPDERTVGLSLSEKCSVKPSISREEYISSLEQKEIASDILAYPSLDGETQEAISREYQALHERIIKDGFYVCRYSEYGKDSIRFAVLFAAFAFTLWSKWYLTSAVFLGFFWQQIMFVAHDAGHRGITGNFVADTLIGAFVADFCCGLSIGWWKSSHNVHHLVTNSPEHDPDLQNVPIFATGPSYLRTMFSSFYKFEYVWDAAADVLVKYQKWAYYPIMAVARFNLYFLSWCHLLSPRAANLGSASWTRPVEITFMACYWFLYGYCLVWSIMPDWPTRVAFVLVSHCITMLLHVQITLSHWGMPTSDLGTTESFPQRQLRTTMDIACPEWLDWLHGGLQFQAIHHLFPRVPRHNLRRLQVLVREFCEKTQIKYRCYGFIEGNGIILSRLEEVTKMAATMAKCQSHMSETWESGLH